MGQLAASSTVPDGRRMVDADVDACHFLIVPAARSAIFDNDTLADEGQTATLYHDAGTVRAAKYPPRVTPAVFH